MNLLQSYADTDMEDDDNQQFQNPRSDHSSSPDSWISLPSKSSAPKVNDTMLALTIVDSNRALTKPLDPSQHVVVFNPTYDQLWAPIYGPSHPYAKDGIAQGMRNHKLGFVENAAIAADPEGNNYVGDLDRLKETDGISVYNIPQHEHKKRKLEQKEEESVENEEEGGGGGGGGVEVDNLASETWLLKNQKSPWAGKKEGLQVELTEEQKKYAEEYAKKKGEEKSRNSEKGEFVADKSTFHGKEERDYQGGSWIAAPKDAKATNDHCYIPKRLVHTWSGHTKGVSAIRFFPKHGHLIELAGMDTKVKIWDVFNSGKCIRTYMGHSKAVRDIWFCNDGTQFLTAGYDKNIKYWDTKTGQGISAFSTGKIPYVVRLNPDEDKQNILLAGMSDKKIVQWDMNTGRFVTSSDDKPLRVWEFGIPVVIKYISEPHMQSMPAISLHPNTNWLAAQSLDNQILIYSTRERFQLNNKKRFAGDIVAGYACQVNFSPDGHFVMSRDGEGKCWFWDWKSCKVFRTLKCLEGVCIGCERHTFEQSKVATCGWDGLIKYCSKKASHDVILGIREIQGEKFRATKHYSSHFSLRMHCDNGVDVANQSELQGSHPN
ncbi:unnamed protein product [Camellia sinensis]